MTKAKPKRTSVHKKPTNTFGTMNFSKDGKVKPGLNRLPETKEEQEQEVGRQFFEKVFGAEHPDWQCRPVETEAGHDFVIFNELGDPIIEVQAAEIVDQAFTNKITVNQYLNNPPAEVIQGPPGQDKVPMYYLEIDRERLNDVVVNIIQRKLSKRYAKQDTPLWLLIWTVSSYPEVMANYLPNVVLPTAVQRAKDFIAANDISPFDRVYLFPLILEPRRL